MSDMSNVLRNIPSVHELLESPPLKRAVERVSHNVVVGRVRTFLDQLRADMQNRAADLHVPAPAELAERIAQWILQQEQPRLRPVINATGILLHTGLGRAPLAEEAVYAIRDLCQGYCSLEVDLESGERSQRTLAVERQLTRLTGAEAALVVNNNAAATMLALAALAAGREVIVSRGELVEIGGNYRLPDVMQTSGARLREVGTTNKTRREDYARAISPETGALLKVHTSNYRITGFTESTPLAELVALGREHRLPVIDDIGSGALMDLRRFGIEGEPLAAESIQTGADLVLFSGDKLLGGPQCGILVGRANLIDTIRRHPLMRAMRVDKLTLAALTATLHLYRDPAVAEQRVPLLSLLATPLENLRQRAERLAPQLAATPPVRSATPVEDTSLLGGGSVPEQQQPTWCIALEPEQESVSTLAQRLRLGTPAVMGRIQHDRLLLDLRTVFPAQDTQLVTAFERLEGPKPRPATAAGH